MSTAKRRIGVGASMVAAMLATAAAAQRVSTVLVTDAGEVTDYHLAVIFVEKRP